MRFSVFLTGLLFASGANAHVGHLGELAGHDHRIAAGALGIAIAVAGWNALKGRKDKEAEAEVEAEVEPEAQEA
ncbi:MAG: hypothetical protein QNK92_11560 [Amylibacter sp.]